VGEEVPRPSDVTHPALARLRDLRGDRRVAAALLACVAVAGAAAWVHANAAAPDAPPRAAATPRIDSNTAPRSSSSTTTTTAVLIVDVVGAVRHPGIVRVPAGARVVDAIAAAGGSTGAADLERLNLAALLTDGMRVAVPEVGKPPPSLDPAAVNSGNGGATSDPSGSTGSLQPSAAAPVNLNTATAAQLDALPGIGPATADAIVRDREQNGLFATIDDLARVRGIGPAKLAQIHDLVTV
jgi:competence protein ComEA